MKCYLVEQVCYRQGESSARCCVAATTDRTAENSLVPRSRDLSVSAEYSSSRSHRKVTSFEYCTGQLRLEDVEFDAAVAESGLVEAPTDFRLGDVHDTDADFVVDAVRTILECPALAVHIPLHSCP